MPARKPGSGSYGNAELENTVVAHVAREMEDESTSKVVRRLHGLVTYGPWDLDVASAMSIHGYDEVKWAEGQVMLAELVNCSLPPKGILDAAVAWYEEAAATARRALVADPQLLAKLGIMAETADSRCRAVGAMQSPG
jgi:hypothetical protein